MANGSRSLVGKSAYVQSAPLIGGYTFGAFMGAFRTDPSRADSRFVFELLQGQPFRNWLDVILSGSSINNLRPGDVENFVALVPRRDEQCAIAKVLADAGVETRVLENRLSKARAIKQGIMQELLTGRTRLPIEEAVT